jgi:ADP-ribose pyrophosphatase YjhB (NUDIX family)
MDQQIMELQVAVIVDMSAGLVVLTQSNGVWQLPLGPARKDESLESAALRLVSEQCQLEVELVRQFHTYSTGSMATLVFVARGRGQIQEGPLQLCHEMNLPSSLGDSNRSVLKDYFLGRY